MAVNLVQQMEMNLLVLGLLMVQMSAHSNKYSQQHTLCMQMCWDIEQHNCCSCHQDTDPTVVLVPEVLLRTGDLHSVRDDMVSEMK